MCRFTVLHTLLKMKHTVNFYLRKRANSENDIPISMFVSFKSQRMEYYTGESCKIDQWNDGIREKGTQKIIQKVQRVKKNIVAPSGKTASQINNSLDELKSKVDSFFKPFEAINKYPTVEELRFFLDTDYKGKTIEPIEPIEPGFFDRLDQYIKDSNFSYGRVRHLETSKGKLKKFNPNTSFEILDTQFLTDYKNNLIDSELSRNSVSSELKYLRAFLNYAKKQGWTNNYPFENFSIDAEKYGDPVYITIEERDLLYNAEITSPHLQRVRDIFVFQCLIGCRVGDLVKLKKSNIIDGCIEYIAGKTKDHETRVASVPLTEKALKILSKYNLPGDELLPFISDQRYNEYIRDLFKDKNVKLNRIVTIRDPKTGTGKQVPICDIASSHMARRVFVGSLYQKGIKNEIIASMSGHTQDSKSFNRYYKIDKQSQQDAISLIE